MTRKFQMLALSTMPLALAFQFPKDICSQNSVIRNARGFRKEERATEPGIAASLDQQPPQWTRRIALEGGILSAVSFLASKETTRDEYGLWGVLPVGPYKTKRTAQLETIVDGEVWTSDQKFGILNVQVPSRMVVIRLSAASGGGLWIYNPIAATRDLVDTIRQLEKSHGPVRHIVLGTVAIEHKTYCGPFAQKFPDATVWLQPGQYAVPLNLPAEFIGCPIGRTKALPEKATDTPWAADFDHETLGPFLSRDGAFGETAFFHRSTKTLLVTDIVVQITDNLPAIYRLDLKPLLYHSRTSVNESIDPNDETQLRRGWRRIQLFGLFFMPAGINVKSVNDAIKERRPDINSDFAGVYPWDWVGDEDITSFKAIQGNRAKTGPSGLLVAPILQTLILNRNPVEVIDWADRVSRWDFKRIIPAHLQNNVPSDGITFRRAFTFLEEDGEPPGQPKPREADLETLRSAEVSLVSSGAIAARPPKLGKGNRRDVLAASQYVCKRGLCTQRAPEARPSS